MNFKGKIALITGGTRGIGGAAALLLAEAGCNVVIVGRTRDDDALGTLTDIERTGVRSELILADCGEAESCRGIVRQTADTFGRLDILVHCAGGPVDGGLFEIDAETWYRAFDVHVHAIFHLCREAIPMLKANGQGSILIMSSVAGLRAIPTNIAYQAVKGAVPQITRALAYELAEDNIRVNAIAPGVIRTRFHEGMSEERRRHNLDNRIPLHREGTPRQVAEMMVELIGNEYMTGETVVVDGGLTMRMA